MKIRIGRGAVSFMEKNNRARLDLAQDARGHDIGVFAHGIEAAHRPADQLHPASPQCRMHEEILHPGGCAKVASHDPALIDLARDAPRRQTPECAARMRRRMIRHLMSCRADCLQFRREFRGALADDKESRLRFEALQNLEQARRMDRIGSVVDREPDFPLGSPKMGQNRSPPLAVRHQRREKNEHVRNKEHAEREERMKGNDDEKERRGDEREAENQAPAQLRIHGAVSRRESREG